MSKQLATRALPTSGLFRQAVAVWLLLTALAGNNAAQTVPKVDGPMWSDPTIEIPPPKIGFSEKLAESWAEALRHPEADLRHQAAYSVTWAATRDAPGLTPVIEPLLENLSNDRRLIVRLASARALIALDARHAAPALLRQAERDGTQMAMIVEPALARWDVAEVRTRWQLRLRTPDTDRRSLLLAIRGAGQLRDDACIDSIRRLVHEAAGTQDVRLSAAEAAGKIREQGLEDDAEALLSVADASIIDRLAAAHLLRHHSGSRAQTLLLKLARDDQSSVAAIALARLYELDPELLLPLAADSLAKGDVNVRRVIARALVARPNDTSLRQLGDLLEDLNPSLRAMVADSLVELAASEELRTKIIQQAERILTGESWQGLEQSIRVLTLLEYNAQVNRFLDLLSHRRPEVYVTAAWGVRRVGGPEALPSALKFADKRYEDRMAFMQANPFAIGLDDQLSQLVQLFGAAKYRPSEEFLRKFIPKSLELPFTRGGAIWALGHLYDGDPNAELVAALVERVRDVNPLQPELAIVRMFSAVSLGRMQARDSLPTLRDFFAIETSGTSIGYACAWSIERMTGEPFKRAEPRDQFHSNFFLEPLSTR